MSDSWTKYKDEIVKVLIGLVLAGLVYHMKMLYDIREQLSVLAAKVEFVFPRDQGPLP